MKTAGTRETTISFYKFVLSLFATKLDKVEALVRDNCSTNKLLARRCNVGFVGCAIYRFNPAMKDMIQKHVTIIEKVRAVMKKLSYPILAAELRKHTHLRAKCSNVTRWSSTSQMLKRYIQIKEIEVNP